jgi:hypothetical protein
VRIHVVAVVVGMVLTGCTTPAEPTRCGPGSAMPLDIFMNPHALAAALAKGFNLTLGPAVAEPNSYEDRTPIRYHWNASGIEVEVHRAREIGWSGLVRFPGFGADTALLRHAVAALGIEEEMYDITVSRQPSPGSPYTGRATQMHHGAPFGEAVAVLMVSHGNTFHVAPFYHLPEVCISAEEARALAAPAAAKRVEFTGAEEQGLIYPGLGEGWLDVGDGRLWWAFGAMGAMEDGTGIQAGRHCAAYLLVDVRVDATDGEVIANARIDCPVAFQ